MFNLPEAKRVRREDLARGDDFESSDGDMDAELQARLNAQIAKSLGLDLDIDHEQGEQHTARGHKRPASPGPETETQPADTQDGQDGQEEDGFAFRLFNTAGPAPRVVLEDPEQDQGEGAFVRCRPLSHYLAGAPSAELRSQYEFAAVTGDEVVSRSRARSWGMELPWKVTTIKVLRRAGAGGEAVRGEGEGATDAMDAAGRRRRPGKKRRLAMRTKERAKAKAKEAAKQKEAEKEEHIKEKKKRMNRLKKLRKRAKKKGDKEGGGDEEDSGSD